jgi:predicted lipoprotein with Yx(FWY)xxD motif
MNKVKLMALGAVLVLLLGACSAYSPQAPAPTTAPSGAPAAGQPAAGQATVMVASNATLGSILVDAKGMTLYTFANDTANTSNCTGSCAAAWPPLTVAQGTTPTAGPGVTGTLGVIQRADGTYQVTLDGKPLYYFAKDTKPGDTTGQGLNNLWYVVQLPATS